jgi:8-oxo-dGTP pyrophosphatase MutT (NUDIX family)
MKFNKEDRIKKTRTAILHESAGGFVFFKEVRSQQLFVALLKTTEGEYVIPKGHLKKNENSKEAALREIREELLLNRDPRVIGKLGTMSYEFTRPEDKLPHRKKVHLFVFSFTNKEMIAPLKSEGFVVAEWIAFPAAMKKITFNKKELIKAKKFFLHHSGLGVSYLDKAIADVVRDARKSLASNLTAIILTGSVARGTHRNGWSDVDILFVVEVMDIKIKNDIAEMVRRWEIKTGVHHGVNIVTVQEITKPSVPTISLDGKTLQALVELRQYPDRLLYLKKGRVSKFYTPNIKEVREYSLANIGMFARKSRRDLTAPRPARGGISKELLKTEIRASFTIVKLALQYFKEYSEQTPILDQAKTVFPSYDFGFLKSVRGIIDNWESFNNKKDIAAAVMRADCFIEGFSQYVYRRARKPIRS